MKVSALITVMATSFVAVEASFGHAANNLAARHPHLAQSRGETEAKSMLRRKSCAEARSLNDTGKKHKPHASSSSEVSHSTGSYKDVIGVKSNCGPTGATKQITATSGPNGDIEWLNCGINDGGWKPPFVRVSDIVSEHLPSAIKDPKSPFKPCAPYVQTFEKYGNEFGVPSIILASFALQESSCNPRTIGGAGEQGLMQITKEKCRGAPRGNCLDPDFNIRTGARYFSETLKNNHGDLLKSIGMYNGWYTGMTYSQATAAAKSHCCTCQNNLDYLHQFLNGWILNHDAYNSRPKLGKYFNLNVCK